jgi:F-type H+-transporting ATPase subunit b
MTSDALAQEAPKEPAAETHEGVVVDGGPHGGNAFPPFDSTNWAPQFVWLVLIFGALYLLMSRIALPRVADILTTRETTINDDLDSARASQAKAQIAAKHNDATLAAKKDEAQAIGREAQAKVAAEAGALRASAEQKLAQALAAAEQRIAAEKAEKMAHVENVAKEAAAAIVAKLTGVQADAAAIDAAVRSLSAR